MLDMYEAGDRRYSRQAWVLWMTFSVDLWLRSLFPELTGAPGPMVRDLEPRKGVRDID